MLRRLTFIMFILGFSVLDKLKKKHKTISLFQEAEFPILHYQQIGQRILPYFQLKLSMESLECLLTITSIIKYQLLLDTDQLLLTLLKKIALNRIQWITDKEVCAQVQEQSESRSKIKTWSENLKSPRKIFWLLLSKRALTPISKTKFKYTLTKRWPLKMSKKKQMITIQMMRFKFGII